MTHKEYLQNSGREQRAIAYRFKVCGVGAYSADAELSEEHLEMLTSRYGAQKQPQQRKVAQKAVSVAVYEKPTAQTLPQTLPQIIPQSAQIESANYSAKSGATKDASVIFYASFANTLISIALTFCGMYAIAGLFGAGLGAMFGLFLLAAVIAARNAETGDTSEDALKTVLYLELGACLLHPYTFFTSFGKMGVTGEWYVLAAAAAVCAAFIAVLSYNSVKLIRNYYAEIKQ